MSAMPHTKRMPVSRRGFLRRTTAAGAIAAAAWLAGRPGRGAAQSGPAGGDCPDAATLAALPDLTPLPPNDVEALIGLFDDYPLVALGEDHGVQEIHDFIGVLVRHPAFPSRVNDIVVEFGNALYQDVMDRYVAGEDVPLAELRQVWRNTTQGANWGTAQTWESPVYLQTFAAVREANRALPPSRRVRVLLGDPPIDWGQVRREEDALPFLEQRDSHYAAVVERDVLDRGRRALLVAGVLHVLRDPNIRDPTPRPGFRPNVVTIVDHHHPGKTFVLVPHMGHPVELDPDRSLERRLASLPVPSIARIKGTWYGKLGCFTDPRTGAATYSEDQADGMCYLGPGDALTLTEPSPFIYRDDAFFHELQRRHLLMTGGPLPEDEPRYYLHGVPGIEWRPGGPGGGPGAPMPAGPSPAPGASPAQPGP